MQRVPRYDPYARPPQQHAVPHGAAGHQREAEHSNPLSYAQPGVATSTPYEASYEPGGPSRFGSLPSSPFFLLGPIYFVLEIPLPPSPQIDRCSSIVRPLHLPPRWGLDVGFINFRCLLPARW